MSIGQPSSDARERPEFLRRFEHRMPYWQPQLVVLLAILIDFALPDRLSPLRPSWILPALEALLLIGIVAISPHPRWRHSPLRRRVALGLTGLVSLTNIASLVLLCHYLLQPSHGHAINNGHALIISGFGLWVTNVLLFGLWYWEVDRGGPAARGAGVLGPPDFLFPQMSEPRYASPDWKPSLLDYLYVSFTNATAFSPTDAMPLTAMAKALMTVQSLAALITVGLVVARAVNILQQ